MDIAETIKFRDICVMLEKIKKATGHENKGKYICRYYESFQNHRLAYRQEKGVEPNAPETGGTSFFCILRCLIPNADKSRDVYRLQISSLSKIYVKILQLSPDSHETKSLYARDPSGIRGDYADIVYSVLQARCKQEYSDLTLQQIHNMLDSIASDDRKNTEKVLTQLTEVCSAMEQMWFIRLLLKSMHLGIGEQVVLPKLHPLAKSLYQRCMNLSLVCCHLADNKLDLALNNANSAGEQAVLAQLNEAIEPFQFIRPMLCEIFPGNLEQLMSSDVLYMETKMDGERFQLHMCNGRFKYLSRNGNDYTSSFGESIEIGCFTPLLANLLPIGTQSIILDGEMMVWDIRQMRFRVKGENTDVKHLSSSTSFRPCFVVYDLLFLNGSSLLEATYVQRCQKLKDLLKLEKGVLEIMKPIKITCIEEFKNLFQARLDSHEEGVVLKKKNSLYKPGMRYGGGWYKVKADYIEGATTEFDLLIMGGFYNRTRTFIESFLLGVLKYESNAEQYEVFSVAKVPNIIRQRVILNNNLKEHWRLLTTEPPPAWYHYAISNAEGRPDVWIEPKQSTVLQIRATELAPSSEFALSKSLRFPRIVAWRNDKVWNEVMLLPEYLQLTQKAGGGIKKINKREMTVADFMKDRKSNKLTAAMKRKMGIQSYDNRFDATTIKKNSNIFEGLSFCVLSASLKNGYSLEEIKAMIVQNSGTIVENPIPQDPKCMCIAGDETFRVLKLKKHKRYNIATLNWLLSICAKQEMVLKPKHMISTTEDIERQFNESFDQFGDSFVDYVDEEDLLEILHDMNELTLEPVTSCDEEALQRKCNLNNSFEFFWDCLGYFYENEQRSQFAKILFEWRKGKCINIADEKQGTFYVFIDLEHFDKVEFHNWLLVNLKDDLKSLMVVSIDWIIHSHNAKKKLDVLEYSWHDF